MSADSHEADFRSVPIPEMERILARFEERIHEAQKAGPATKDWVKKAVRRQGSGRCPVRINRTSVDLIIRYGDALADLFCEYPDDIIVIYPYDYSIGYQPADRIPRINPLEVLMRDARWTDEWGTVWGHAAGGVGATTVDCPLKDWGQLDEYLATQMPDPRAPGRLDAALPIVSKHGGSKYLIGNDQLMLFERLHSLRGMQELFVDFYSNENELRRLLKALEEYNLEFVRNWAEIGVDAVFFTDDWGSQNSLMLSPSMWREFFKHHYVAVFNEVHRLGMDVYFHSCGNITLIVGDLIDAGVDVLDPIQPGAMDIEAIVKEYGGQVTFCGGIDVQHLICEGTPSQIKDTVSRLIEVVGRPFGGGMVVAPANAITPETPLENLRALFEAAHDQ